MKTQRELFPEKHVGTVAPHDDSKKILSLRTHEDSKNLIPDDLIASLDWKIDETLDFSCEMLIQQCSQHKWQDIERIFVYNWP